MATSMIPRQFINITVSRMQKFNLTYLLTSEGPKKDPLMNDVIFCLTDVTINSNVNDIKLVYYSSDYTSHVVSYEFMTSHNSQPPKRTHIAGQHEYRYL